MESIKSLTGEYPKGWYYGRLSPRSHALVWDVYKEKNAPLVWYGRLSGTPTGDLGPVLKRHRMSDTYADDVPYWQDVPAEKNSPNPEGMLMVPYSYDCNDFKWVHYFTRRGCRTTRLLVFACAA